MASKKQFFPASIVDETAYFMEGAGNTTVTNGWILTLEGEVDSDIVRQALLSTFKCYPKYKCILSKDYPSYKHWFRYRWQYRETIDGEDILQELEESTPDPSKDAVCYFRELYASNRIDVTRHIPLKIILIRKPELVIIAFFQNHILSDGKGKLCLSRRFIQFYEAIYYHRKKEDIPDFKSIPLPVIRPPWKDCSRRHLSIYLEQCRLFFREPAVEVHHSGGEGSVGDLTLVARVLSPDEFSLLKASHALYPSLCLSNMGVCDYNRSHRDEEGFHYMGPARIIGSNAVTAAIPWPPFFIHTYNSKMEVSLSAFRSHFSFEAAHMLLDTYIQELTGRYN